MPPKRVRIAVLFVLVCLAGCLPGGPRTATPAEKQVVVEVPVVTFEAGANPSVIRELTPDRPLFAQATATPTPTRPRPTDTPTPPPPTLTPVGYKTSTPWATPVPPYPMPVMVDTPGPSPTMIPYELLHPPTQTPSVTPTRPTPFPEPDLRSWDGLAPAAEPLFPDAEIARDYLAQYAGVGPESVRLGYWVRPTNTETGEMVWIGRFYYGSAQEVVFVLPDGTVGLAPDRGDACRAIIAQERGIDIGALRVHNAAVGLYIHAEMYVYDCMIRDADGGRHDVAIDWWNQRVDVAEVKLANRPTSPGSCPKMFDGLCMAIRGEPDRVHDVYVVPSGNVSQDALLARVSRDDPEAFEHGGWLHARLTGRQVRALADDPTVGSMDLDHERRYLLEDKPLSPLDRNLRLDLAESDGHLNLSLWTFPDYGCCNYELIADVSQPLPQQLRVEVAGVYKPFICLTAFGPARATLALGELEGRWRLNIAYPPLDLNDEYMLDVGEDMVRLEQRHATFTWALHGEWPLAAP